MRDHLVSHGVHRKFVTVITAGKAAREKATRLVHTATANTATPTEGGQR